MGSGPGTGTWAIATPSLATSVYASPARKAATGIESDHVGTPLRRDGDAAEQLFGRRFDIIRMLNQTFITPFDREDIHALTSSLDDVLDYVNSAATRMKLYGITAPPPASAVLAALIVTQSEELSKGVSLLAEENQRVLDHCVEVNRLENEADRVSRSAIAELFEHEKDPIQLIKIKELYEVLETATDKAEDAANVLEAVVLKST